MKSFLLGWLLLALLIWGLSCSTHNAGTALPDYDEDPGAGATSTGPLLETYYWHGQADPEPATD